MVRTLERCTHDSATQPHPRPIRTSVRSRIDSHGSALALLVRTLETRYTAIVGAATAARHPVAVGGCQHPTKKKPLTRTSAVQLWRAEAPRTASALQARPDR